MNDGEDRVLVSQLRNSVVRVSLVLSLKLLEQRVVVGSGEAGEGRREMARKGGKERNRQRRHITHIRRKRKEEINTIWNAMSISLNKQKLCLVL